MTPWDLIVWAIAIAVATGVIAIAVFVVIQVARELTKGDE